MVDTVVYYWLKARNMSYLILETDAQQCWLDDSVHRNCFDRMTTYYIRVDGIVFTTGSKALGLYVNSYIFVTTHIWLYHQSLHKRFWFYWLKGSQNLKTLFMQFEQQIYTTTWV